MSPPGDLTPANLVCIMSDQHTRRVMGAAGDPCASTPNLDALARRGTMFPRAYCTSPICVPARASFATGRYVHELGCWDNDAPYDGSQGDSWGRRLSTQGHRVATVGKLHYRSAAAPTGFDEQHLAMHVLEGVGGARGLLRDNMPPLERNRGHVLEAGPGETEYTRYDREIAGAAAQWLREEGRKEAAPWVLFVSFVSPHYPLVCPPDYFGRVDTGTLPEPVAGRREEWSQHPAMQLNRRLQGHDRPFAADRVQAAVRAYYGLVAFLDAQIGRVLAAVDESGLAERTRVLYTSDHGEMLGDHGLWWKHTMYEGSVGIPLVCVGPGVPVGTVNPTPVSTVDFFPTIVNWVGARRADADRGLPGRSLGDFFQDPQPERTVFSEYHAVFSGSAIYLVVPAAGRFKYVHYVGHPPQLFDLDSDPDERNDLAGDPMYGDTLARCERELRHVVDPDEVDRAARRSQHERLVARGGRHAVLQAAGSFTHTPAPVPE